MLRLLLALSVFMAPSRRQDSTAVEMTIRVDGFDRTYLVHLPRHRTSTGKRPVVMMLHGRGATSRSTASEFGWIEKADAEDFIVVFPQALPIDPGRPSGATLPDDFTDKWKSPTNDAIWWTHTMAKVFRVVLNHRYDGVVHPVDAPYLAAVLRDVLRRYGGDSRRVYVVGFSSGAAMAADFAQSAPNAMAAVGIVGNVGLDRPRTLGQPVSAFLAIGVDDAFGKQTPASWSALPRVARQVWYGQDSLPTLEQDAATWARLDGCGSRGVTTTAWGQQLDWTGCERRAHVRALSVDHLGHEWAGSTPSQWNRLHPAQPPLYLTDLLWRFFESAGAD